MSDRSSINGKAFEFALLNVFSKNILFSNVVENNAWSIAKTNFGSLDDDEKKRCVLASQSAYEIIVDAEPNMIDDITLNDNIQLSLQDDNEGIVGDVRDILIKRNNIEWEIGISAKHNHFAIKHSRLSKQLDFGRSWYEIPCSQTYWNDIQSIFELTNSYKEQGMLWRELDSKSDDIYIPLLNSFINEVRRAYDSDNTIVSRLVEYLVGKLDYHKVVSVNSKKETRVLSINIHGTLNQKSKNIQPAVFIPVSDLPTEIIDIRLKPNNDNTVELYMNNGWQFSFRIHNASSKVENSLKFDVQPISMPTTVIEFVRKWD